MNFLAAGGCRTGARIRIKWRDDTTSDPQGCQSKAWIHCEEQDGRLHIWGDSEALIIKGIIAVAIVMFQDQKKEDIAGAKACVCRGYRFEKNQISVAIGSTV
ncbi:MAG: SufE family protein [Eubacterium sp.]